eukprot:1946917-Amphidinium_carterae.1
MTGTGEVTRLGNTPLDFVGFIRLVAAICAASAAQNQRVLKPVSLLLTQGLRCHEQGNTA